MEQDLLLTEQELVRRKKMNDLREKGIDPFGKKFERDANSKSIKEKYAEYEKETLEEINESKEIIEDFEDKDEEDTMNVWDEESHSYTIIRIVKGYTARLIQSSEDIKSYYDAIKNELLSYENVKSKINFKYETFKFEKENIARLRFRGKTLCLYLALNPSNYLNSKYKIENMSGVSSSNDVPTMYRITLPRRVEYAKELIHQLMKKYKCHKIDGQFIKYSDEYHYVDDEVLLEKGLIKKSVKVVGNGDSTKTVVNPINIVKQVNKNEANELISDKKVLEFVLKSERIADTSRKITVNVDTLSKYFNESETVTLSEIKKRVPNVDKKATYYKVLARGSIDKPLTVDADDFSIEAEKMIVLTGGKILVSSKK